MTRAFSRTIVTSLVAGAALVAIITGVALYPRGVTMGAAPDIQTVAVVLKNGTALNVQTREVTVAQWQDCFDAGFCTLDLSLHEKNVDYPATGLNYPDAMEYVGWLNKQSKQEWRLPKSSEWNELAYDVLPHKKDLIFTDPSLAWASTYLTEASRTGRKLRPSGTFQATPAGIEDLSGNVWEWTQDCYAGSNGQGEVLSADLCPAFIMGGEHEAVISYLVRDPARGGCAVGTPPPHLGIRLVSEAS